jgi:tRNA pseudouridine55 synthase
LFPGFLASWIPDESVLSQAVNTFFLNVAKPRGWTSGRVLSHVRRSLGIRKVGHWGTLDPEASGVLPVAVGGATRLLPYLDPWPKVYLAVIRLGIETDSCDLAGKVIAEAPVPPLTPDLVSAALARFTGEILQAPPAFAAVRSDGVRAYERARRGEEVVLAPRPVTVKRIELLAIRLPDLVLRVTCGPGTYIRSIARDLGGALSTRGTLARLVRSRSGPFLLREARSPRCFTPGYLAAGGEGVVSPMTALPHLRRVELGSGDLILMRQGRDLPPPAGVPSAAGEAKVLLHAGDLVGIGRIAPGGWVHPETVLAAGEVKDIATKALPGYIVSTEKDEKTEREGGTDS